MRHRACSSRPSEGSAWAGVARHRRRRCAPPPATLRARHPHSPSPALLRRPEVESLIPRQHHRREEPTPPALPPREASLTGTTRPPRALLDLPLPLLRPLRRFWARRRCRSAVCENRRSPSPPRPRHRRRLSRNDGRSRPRRRRPCPAAPRPPPLLPKRPSCGRPPAPMIGPPLPCLCVVRPPLPSPRRRERGKPSWPRASPWRERGSGAPPTSSSSP
mmetsp:Transcript_49240/g.148208  ORF Transcript_49240/g.148208 Transcript_49240/m.148208 type:complete len:218 (-) Transcript_49240:1843-2496(-)